MEGIEEGDYVLIRPFVKEFLQLVSQLYEIVVFTSGKAHYARSVLRIIDPMNVFVSRVFSREHCIQRRGVFYKDFRIIKDRSIKDLVLLDNSLLSAAFQFDNFLPCAPFYGQEADKELLFICAFLFAIYDGDDVRQGIQKLHLLSYLYQKLAKGPCYQ